MTSSEEKTYIKVPTFDGSQKQWQFYSKKFKAYLAQKDLMKLFVNAEATPEVEVPTNAEVLVVGTDDDKIKH